MKKSPQWIRLPLAKTLGIIVLLALALIQSTTGAIAEQRRVALVIGNDNYTYPSLPNLNNAGKDAEGMAVALERLQFDVILLRDATERQMGRALREFENRLTKADVGLVFYAGHGIQSQGVNWLVPSDAEIDIEADLETQGIDATLLLNAMERAGSKLNILILDACRNNPLPQRSRSAARGLARQALPRGIQGTAIIYAAGENEVAQDGPPGSHGVFTGRLLTVIETPGLKLEDVFKKTAIDVSELTGGQQDPWYYSNIKGDFYFVPEGSEVTVRPPQASTGVDKEALFWDSVKDSRNKAEFEAYLKQYPEGTFTALARSRMEDLEKGPQGTDDGAPSRVFNQESLFWDTIKTSENQADFEAYLAQYPDGVFATLAKLRIKAMNEAGEPKPPAQDEETIFWNTVRSINAPEAYQSYLNKFPNGAHREEAERRLAAVRLPKERPGEKIDPIQEPSETASWTKAKQDNTREAYQAYLDAFPEGNYASLARLKMAALAPSGRTNDTTVAPVDERERDFWTHTLGIGSRAAFQAYLDRYPNGAHVPMARLKMAALPPETKIPETKTPEQKSGDDRAEDELFWTTMRAINSKQAYQSYLEKFPDGAHAEEAHNTLAALSTGTAPPSRRWARVRLSGPINARLGPSTSSRVIDRLAAGTEVELLGQSKDGYWFEVALPGGGTGFVYRELVNEVKPDHQEPVAGKTAPLPPPGESFRDCAQCPEMVALPTGEFLMGSARSTHAWYLEHGGKQQWAASELPRHEVRIRYRLAAAKTEVTRDQFAAFVEDTKYKVAESCKTFQNSWKEKAGASWRSPDFSQTGKHPVVCVDFAAAKAYARWLTETTGFDYRLPSEAEWEFLARAGTTTGRYWGEDFDNEQGCTYANVADQGSGWDPHFKCDDGYKHTAPVASYLANDFGLHDVIGNVWEWTEECWHSNYSGAPDDGSSRPGGDCQYRVVRGGAWDKVPGVLRVSQRNGDKLDQRYNNLGFRVVRTLSK